MHVRYLGLTAVKLVGWLLIIVLWQTRTSLVLWCPSLDSRLHNLSWAESQIVGSCDRVLTGLEVLKEVQQLRVGILGCEWFGGALSVFGIGAYFVRAITLYMVQIYRFCRLIDWSTWAMASIFRSRRTLRPMLNTGFAQNDDSAADCYS